jgi:hypothetical protein
LPAVWALAVPCGAQQETPDVAEMALARWTPCPANPVFVPGPSGAWDENIRERLWVLREDGRYHAWYGGWRGTYDKNSPNLLHLGYATSDDGVHWTKHPGNPVFDQRWTEDVCVVKTGDTYYLYAEDETANRTVIHLLTSRDKVHWTPRGAVLEAAGGIGWEKGYVGTPLAWREADRWFLIYEGGPPNAIGLATSRDGISWNRDPGNPVLTAAGERDWPTRGIVPQGVVKIGGAYHLFYHAYHDAWKTGYAASHDLHRWVRHPANPILPDKSAVVLDAGDRYLLYTHAADEHGYNLYTSPKRN